MTAAGRVIISVRHLVKVFSSAVKPPLRAVDDVSFSITRGELVLIKGPSGSGKTTMLSMMGCLMRPSSGSITIGNTEVCTLRQHDLTEFRLENIGFVFQGFRLIEYLTVLQNVLLAMMLNGISRRDAIRKAEGLLSQVDLSDRLHSVTGTLSGGEKQRVAIARALANDPAIILADEPTGSLDSAGGRNVIGLLSDLTVRSGMTVVIVSHDERIVPRATRVMHIEDGRII